MESTDFFLTDISSFQCHCKKQPQKTPIRYEISVLLLCFFAVANSNCSMQDSLRLVAVIIMRCTNREELCLVLIFSIAPIPLKSSDQKMRGALEGHFQTWIGMHVQFLKSDKCYSLNFLVCLPGVMVLLIKLMVSGYPEKSIIYSYMKSDNEWVETLSLSPLRLGYKWSTPFAFQLQRKLHKCFLVFHGWINFF